EVLRLPGVDDSGKRWAREVIERQVQQMTRLVDDLLDISRITHGKFELHKERVELSHIVHLAVETVRPAIDARRHELTVTVPPEPIWLDADPTRLAQALANLLHNATKYTAEAGHISLTAERGDGEVTVRVRDNGE